MSLEPQNVPEQDTEQGLGSLRGCLVEGDAEQSRRERLVRRRALVISVVLQSAVLTLLVLVPLFGKTERIIIRDYVPIPPYGHASNHPRGNGKPTTSRPTNPDSRFTFHPPTNRVSPHPVEDPNPTGPIVEFGSAGNHSNDGPDCSWCVNIGGKDAGPRPPQPLVETRTRPQVVRMTHLDPAMLIHRVEPVYPPLAKQTHREGRVELRAIIGTDVRSGL